jgi:hypothetical protein
VSALALSVLLTGCQSGEVPVDSPAVEGTERDACAALVDALPDTVSEELRRPVDPDDALGAAWGDPAIVLRCGVGAPEGFDRFSPCQEADGVGWFVPREQSDEPGADVVMTTIEFEPRVEVRVPATYRPPAGIMVELAPAIKAHLTEVSPCG